MDKRLKIGLALLVCASILVASGYLLVPRPSTLPPREEIVNEYIASTVQPLGEEPWENFTINCTIPDFPEEVPLLKVVGCQLTEEELLALAREDPFNLTGDLIYKQSPWGDHHIKDAFENSLVFPSDGGVKIYRVEYSPHGSSQLPSFSTVWELGDLLISKMAKLGLIPQDPSIEIVRDRAGVCETEVYDGQEYVRSLKARYYVLFDGLVLGSISVEVGHGSLCKMIYGCRRIEKVGTIRLELSPIEALERLASDPMGGRPDGFVVNEVLLGYYNLGLAYHQDYLPPAYIFKGVYEGHPLEIAALAINPS